MRQFQTSVAAGLAGVEDQAPQAEASRWEETRRPRVRWEGVVLGLARAAAWYSFVLMASVAALGVLTANLHGRGIGLVEGLALVLFSGLAAAGGVGLIVLLYQDHRFDYEQVTRRILPGQPAEPDQVARPLAAGPLHRRLSRQAIRYGRVRLSVEQKVSLARMIHQARELSLSGRRLEAHGVITDRTTQARELQEDLLALGYARKEGQTLVATPDLADILEEWLPPPP